MRWILALVLAGGCMPHDQLKVDVVCQRLCACAAPDEQAECEADCPQFVQPDQISEACFQCYLDARAEECSYAELTCEPICDPDDGPPEQI